MFIFLGFYMNNILKKILYCPTIILKKTTTKEEKKELLKNREVVIENENFTKKIFKNL